MSGTSKAAPSPSSAAPSSRSALPPKAESVSAQGAPDGFQHPLAWQAQVLPGGYTRLVVSAPPERLPELHLALLGALEAPLRVLYRQLTERSSGQLDKPRDWVGAEISHDRLRRGLNASSALVYHDGRHQLWVKGQGPEQVVLEEIGVIFAYPDDPAYREVLLAAGVPERRVQTMAERDYVKVNFLAEADAQERELMQALGLVRWS